MEHSNEEILKQVISKMKKEITCILTNGREELEENPLSDAQVKKYLKVNALRIENCALKMMVEYFSDETEEDPKNSLINGENNWYREFLVEDFPELY